MVCLVKTTCIPSFVLIGCCMSELYGHLCPYRNVLPEAVLQELHSLQKRNFPIPWSLWISISTQNFVSQFCPVIEIHELKLKKKNNNKMKNCENELLPILVIFLGPPYFHPRYPFVKTDSRLSVYCHGNAECMGAMLANLHATYYRPFVIWFPQIQVSG